jgi:hypothetical protein
MRYLLVVGFNCKVYRREPRARLFFNEKLIDEFNIENYLDNTENEIRIHAMNLQPHGRESYSKIIDKTTDFLKFYEIDINEKESELNLYIDIHNDDSNYVNGFISLSTLLQLRFFYFFPFDKKILARLEKIMIKNMISKNIAWYFTDKNIIFNLSRFCQWQGKNKQIFDSNNFNLKYTTIGGSGRFKCNLKKKYGIFLPKLKKSYRYKFDSRLINDMIDKYKNNAN